MWKTFLIATEIPGFLFSGSARHPIFRAMSRTILGWRSASICIQVPVSGLGHTTAQLESECTPEGAGFQRCALGYRPWAMTLFETPLVVVCIYVHICTYIYIIYYIYIYYIIYYIYIIYILYILYIYYIYILYIYIICINIYIYISQYILHCELDY